MLIKHVIKNNQIEITVSVPQKIYKSDRTLHIDTKYIVDFCKKNDIPVGTLIQATGYCSNNDLTRKEGFWVFGLSKEYKKRLTSKKENATINKEKSSNATRTKKSSTRARVSRVVSKTRAKKNNRTKMKEDNEQQ